MSHLLSAWFGQGDLGSGGRLGGPHDGGDGVVVDAVALDDLDVDEAGTGKELRVLLGGEGASDAAGALVGGGAGGVVDVGVGDDVPEDSFQARGWRRMSVVADASTSGARLPSLGTCTREARQTIL